MTVLVADRALASRLRAEREVTEASIHDEVWDGVHVVPPSPNNEHQRLATRLCAVLVNVIELPGGGIVCNSVNVSDREESRVQNYRVPDASAFLPGNPAKDRDTHWCGGPDFTVEILSTGDLAREKLPFYAGIGVRELLIIDRDPWALELYRLDAGRLAPVGRSSLGLPDVLASAVLPLAFRLAPARSVPGSR
jgi:Uma2 family endonuclease